MLPSIIAGISAAAAASLLGNLVVLQRLSLAADVLSHVALPGIALALAIELNPFIGGFLFLLMAVLAIWSLEGRTRLPLDALVGVFFSVSLASGALLFAEKEELLEALFGNLKNLAWGDAAVTLAGSALVLGVLAVFFRPLVLTLVSPDLAAAQGITTSKMRLVFLLLLAITVAIGIQATGVLLIGAFLILPAAAAQVLTRGIGKALLASTLIGVGGTLAGIAIGVRTGFEAGPLVVLVLAALFLASLLVRR